MRKWIIIFVPLIFLYLFSEAQENVGCNQLLEDAREAYSAGMVEIVPDLLLSCLEPGGLTGTSRQEAYKLVINAYLFDYLPEEADSLMDDFVSEFPQYKPAESDPAEFTLLFEAHLQALAETGVVAEEENLTDTGGDEKPERVKKAKRTTPYAYENSMGFILGMTGTFPQISERYSVGDPAVGEGSFGIMPGLQGGINLNLILNRSMEASFALVYNQTRFSYSDAPFSFTSYEYKESQSHLQVPASLLFRLNPESKGANIYLRMGIVGDYLLSASGSGTRSYVQSLSDVVVDKTGITESRAKLNLLGMAGLGIRIPFEKSFMFFEARFTSGLFKCNNDENRYLNEDILWLLYHVDSDFRIHQLSLSTGIAWNL
ncbi:MAG: outer membrane beta-barrel protein [Bacteroidota bacterium]